MYRVRPIVDPASKAVYLYKAFVITHPEQARTLLVTHPQLAYALFQALLLNKIVDQGILSVGSLNIQFLPSLIRDLFPSVCLRQL